MTPEQVLVSSAHHLVTSDWLFASEVFSKILPTQPHWWTEATSSELSDDWPVCDDWRLYSCRESTADCKHVGSELNDEVLKSEWSVNDDAVEESYHFRSTAASCRRMYELYTTIHDTQSIRRSIIDQSITIYRLLKTTLNLHNQYFWSAV